MNIPGVSQVGRVVAKLARRLGVRRKRTPTVLQYEAAECGAASLGIILGYYKYFLPLEELRTLTGVSRDGSNALSVVRAARSFGMISGGEKRTAEQARSIATPYVVFWNYNHFLVVENFHKDKVYLNDPATGPRTVPFELFKKSFTGIALTFKPGPDFKPRGKESTLINGLVSRARGSGMALTYVVLTGLALSAIGLIAPTFVRIFIDQYLIDQQSQWVRPLLWIMLAATLLTGVATWLQRYYLLHLYTKMALSTSATFLWHVLRLPVAFFGQRFGGEIASRVQLNNRVARTLSGHLASTTVGLLTILPYAVVLFSYNVPLTVIGLAMAIANLVALHIVSRMRTDSNTRFLQERGKMIGSATSGLAIIDTLKASGTEGEFFSRLAGYEAKVIGATQQLGRLTQVLDSVPAVVHSLNGTAMLCIGAWFVMDGELGVGSLMAFQALMVAFIKPFSSLLDLGSQVQTADGDMNRLDDVLRAEMDPEIQARDLAKERLSQGPKSSDMIRGYVELKNVTFGYDMSGHPLVKNFNMKVAPGQRVALVGSSGSGKSTIANLICGLYQPQAGEVLIDGKPRAQWPRTVITTYIANVSQDVFLFDGTILENLTLWDPTIEEAKVVAAARGAVIHDAISARPNGYQSMVLEGGKNFSGGQRQRLELARALALSPRILVLDEATSALDTVAEAKVHAYLRSCGVTCIFVAHRLSTVRDADEIIVLSRGQVVQRGTHDELKDEKGMYATLIAH